MVAEHSEPDGDRVTGLRFDSSSLGPEVLSRVGEAGGTPQAAQNIDGLCERLHLFARRAAFEAKGSIGRLVHRPPTTQDEDEPTAGEAVHGLRHLCHYRPGPGGEAPNPRSPPAPRR